MEKKVHHYSIEGLEIDVPLKKRKGENGYIEDLTELIDHPQYTPLGHPIILTNNEACELFEESFYDCAECDYFKGVEAEHFTLIGICTNEKNKKK